MNKTINVLWSAAVVVLIFVLPSAAQKPECFFVQFDKSFYAAGENIWFKMYRFNGSNRRDSRVLYVDLVSHQNQSITRQKLLVEYGTANGCISIPATAEEGRYLFRAYTSYNQNLQPAHIFEKQIPIYQSTQPSFAPSNLTDNNVSKKPQNGEISIVMDKRVYLPRDSLTLSIQLNPQDSIGGVSNLSVSVVPISAANYDFESQNLANCWDNRGYKGQSITPQRSLLLEGRLLDSNSKQPTSKLITVYMQKASQVIKAFSDEGRIRLPVIDYWGSETFQILNLDPYGQSDMEFIPDSGRFSMPAYFQSNPPVRSSKVVDYLNQLKKRRKIAQLFDVQVVSEIRPKETSYKTPDAVYRSEDYQGIYSFEDFINSAIANVRVRSINEVKTVRLFNREEGDLFMEHPWYIVDGFLTFDEKEVLKIDYKDIVEVKLYSKTSTVKQYFKHFMWRSGVLEIITRDVKHVRNLKNKPNVAIIEGFTTNQTFDSTLSKKDQQTPDFRGTIYWLSNVFTNERGESKVTIPLSDDTGQFAVVVMGIANTQTLLRGQTTFRVKQE